MKKLMAINMLSGFFLLFFCGLMGVFLRIEVIQQYVFSPGASDSWRVALFRSSHAHGTLFALLQIVYVFFFPSPPPVGLFFFFLKCVFFFSFLYKKKKNGLKKERENPKHDLKYGYW